MVTVPSEFSIPAGVVLQPKRVANGILYEFVEPADDFFDFSSEILQDLIAANYSGQELLDEFNRRKQKIHDRFAAMVTHREGKSFTREEFEKEIGL
ncbi:hypothetical protein FC18_GL001182 [Lacticaseibacillus sharpeae JCM 1186 = DSM 20505]|uniref:Uncharacterized protein n=2 Tax=Lacticaseibacillus sharpeae TaxID=1626 RepID=A0A0R1ZKS4_9LACO|nr:hypothetical protein FC18_GL001182 [Lacticaseibacillus sharpeae JCM 1186 = DSM 20505]